MKTQTALKTALLLTVLAMMTACGQAKDGSMDSSSRAPVSNTKEDSDSRIYAYCNEKSLGGLTAKVMVYTDSANNIRNDFMRVKITQIPASFEKGDYLEFFRWQANSVGETYLDQNPVKARFETLDGRILTEFSPVIYWGQVAQIAANSGITDAKTFFQHVQLVVDIRDPQAQYDVLKVAFYNTNNEATIDMDMLMPAFSASPVDYQKDKGAVRPMILQNLHPFANKMSQAWTPAQFQSMTNSFCF